MIGALNDIVFIVSSDFVRTLSGLQKTRTARIAKHEIIGNKPKLEFQGEDLIEVSFDMRLDVSLGVNPQRDIDRISTILATGEIVDFITGDVYHGSFLISNTGEVTKYTDRRGNILVAELSVSLTEYVYD
ncbi:MAG: hypothetical protein [Caudoviricetes sp.]|nr:MAG: hypothetical protein [Caudoviricetes sp.]